MKKFQFSLESFLRYKKYIERKAQLDVAKARADVLEGENRIDNLKKKYAEVMQNLDDEMSSGINADRYMHFTQYLTGINSFLDTQNKQQKSLRHILNEKQEKLAQASTSKKVLENLRLRRKEEYYSQILESLYKEADDMITLRKAREINR